MRRRMLPALLAFAVLFAAGLAGAQTLGVPPKAEPPRAEPPQGEPPQGKVTRTSRPVRLLRSWEEPVKLANGQESGRRVDLVFHYDEGVAYENFYTLSGTSAGSKRITQSLPSPSPEEIAEAFELVRNDPGLARLLARFHPVLEGGFVLEEGRGKPCGPGARCLHVMLMSSDRAALIRRVVVDLARLELAYKDYEPPPSGRTMR